MEDYPLKTMEQLNSVEFKIIFRKIARAVIIGLTKSGRKAWQEEETRKETSIVLIRQEQSYTASSSRSFRTQSHWSYFTWQYCHSERLLPVHFSCRMCNQFTFHHRFGIDTLWSKFWAKDRQFSFCLWIPWTRTIRILIRSTWEHRVMHITCIMAGRNTRIRCIGSISVLLWRKD